MLRARTTHEGNDVIRYLKQGKDALSRASGNRTQAARLLNVSRRTLYNKLDEYGML